MALMFLCYISFLKGLSEFVGHTVVLQGYLLFSMLLLREFYSALLGEAKVSCILPHRGIQLRLTDSWASPAILRAGKGRRGTFFICSVSSLSFIFLFLSCPSLSSPLPPTLSLFSLSLGDDTNSPTRVDVHVLLNPN